MKPIFLIGYMGAGKSTLGRALSRQLGCGFIDLDIYIENRYRMKIRDIFNKYGEAHFRNLEQRILNEVSDFEDVVIACGGGTPCFSGNMETMNAHGTTVYLTCPIERIYARLTLPGIKAKRPLIAEKGNEELLQFIADNISVRAPFYEQATLQFDTTHIETAEETEVTAAALLNEIKSLQG